MSTFLKSAKFNGNNGSHFEIIIEYDLISQSVANNSSNVRFYLKMRSLDGYSGGGATATGYINTHNVGTFNSIGRNATIDIGYFDENNIPHNQDGTRNLTYSANINTPWDIGSASVSGAFDLPKINRIGTINSFVGNDLSGNFSATYTTYVSNYNYKLRISIPNVVVLMTIDNYKSGIGVSLDTSSLNKIKQYLDDNSTNKVILGGVIETYNGTTNLGESIELKNECTFVNGEPTFTYTATEVNSKVSRLLGTSANLIVKNASKVRIVVSPTAKYGATISKISITHGDKTYNDTTSPYSIDVPVTTNKFDIEVQDNRTNKATKSTTKTLINYLPVDITNLSMKRVNPTSSNIRLNLEATYYQQTFGSTANVPIVKWKLDNGSYTIIPSSNYVINNTTHKLTITNYQLTNVLDYRNVGQFTLYIEDKLTTDTEGGEKGKILKGIPTYDAGEHDLKVNGSLYLADQNGENKFDVGGLRGKILWENENPSSNFNQQTITLKNYDYDIVEFYFVEGTDNYNSCHSIKIIKGYDGQVIISGTGTFGGTSYNSVLLRNITYLSDTSYSISNAKYRYGNSGSYDVDNVLIPIYVIGYKTRLFE